MGSGAGEDCERYKHNTVPEEHLTLNLWWFLTAAEQVSLFISEEIGTFSGLYFLEHIKKPLIIFILLQFEDEMPPTPISSQPFLNVKLVRASWLRGTYGNRHALDRFLTSRILGAVSDLVIYWGQYSWASRCDYVNKPLKWDLGNNRRKISSFVLDIVCL